MIDKDVFWNTLLKGMDVSVFVAYLVIALIGVLTKFLYDVSKAIREDPATPDKFDWKHFFSSRAFLRWFIDLLVLPLVIVGSKDFLGQDVNVYFAFLIGTGIDGITQMVVGGGITIKNRLK